MKLFKKRRPELLILGDSHTRIFKEPAVEALFPGCELRVVMVGGATASGLANPNSQTQAYPIFKGVLDDSKAKAVIVLLGEVDAGFVIWYRSQRKNLQVRDMLRQAVETYETFLSEVAQRFPVVCISAPLPTITDDNDWGEVANARKEVTASQLARTQMTIEFNRQVGEYCRMHHIRHVNLDNECVGENGLVKDELLNPDEADHHYERDAYVGLLRDHVVDVVNDVIGDRR